MRHRRPAPSGATMWPMSPLPERTWATALPEPIANILGFFALIAMVVACASAITVVRAALDGDLDTASLGLFGLCGLFVVIVAPPIARRFNGE